VLTKAVFQTSEHQDVKDRVMEGSSKVACMIITDYTLEIAVFGSAALIGISGLREFCFLSTIILMVDCIFLFTTYLSVLSLKLEVS
jgi:hydroxymethylglutaryl-CoA reductase (NADPH)